jgi:shikimate kinase
MTPRPEPVSPAAAAREARLAAAVLPPRIVLTGFMGTGKTTVGLRLAQALKRPFVDLDRVIEAAEGMPVAEIFARRGEAAFRALEAREAGRVARLPQTVIATGGGALLHEACREKLLGDGARAFVLTASAEALAARLAPTRAGRPLLAGGDLRLRIDALLAERAVRYAPLGEAVDTTDLSPDDVVSALIERLGG